MQVRHTPAWWRHQEYSRFGEPARQKPVKDDEVEATAQGIRVATRLYRFELQRRIQSKGSLQKKVAGGYQQCADNAGPGQDNRRRFVEVEIVVPRG